MLPDLCQGLVGGVIVAHRDQVGRHDPAGRLLVVPQQIFDFRPVFLLHPAENPFLLFGLEFPQEVSGVVVLEFLDDVGRLFGIECR